MNKQNGLGKHTASEVLAEHEKIKKAFSTKLGAMNIVPPEEYEQWNGNLHKVLERAAVVALSDLKSPEPIVQGPDEYGPPSVRPPKVTADNVRAMFEAAARECEDIAAELHTMMVREEESWTRLAAEFRQVGTVQAEAVRGVLDRLVDLRATMGTLQRGLQG